MSTANASIVSGSATSLVLSASACEKRLPKKDYYASLPVSMKSAARKASFNAYAERFSAATSASMAGALTAGKIRLVAVKIGKAGRTGSTRFEVVKEQAPRAGKVAQLNAENARLNARLAALEARLAASDEAAEQANLDVEAGVGA